MTFDQLKPHGYEFKRCGTCSDCGDDIEWWLTPTKSWVAFNPMSKSSDEARVHRRTSCIEHVDNKKGK